VPGPVALPAGGSASNHDCAWNTDAGNDKNPLQVDVRDNGDKQENPGCHPEYGGNRDPFFHCTYSLLVDAKLS